MTGVLQPSSPIPLPSENEGQSKEEGGDLLPMVSTVAKSKAKRTDRAGNHVIQKGRKKVLPTDEVSPKMIGAKDGGDKEHFREVLSASFPSPRTKAGEDVTARCHTSGIASGKQSAPTAHFAATISSGELRRERDHEGYYIPSTTLSPLRGKPHSERGQIPYAFPHIGQEESRRSRCESEEGSGRRRATTGGGMTISSGCGTGLFSSRLSHKGESSQKSNVEWISSNLRKGFFFNDHSGLTSCPSPTAGTATGDRVHKEESVGAGIKSGEGEGLTSGSLSKGRGIDLPHLSTSPERPLGVEEAKSEGNSDGHRVTSPLTKGFSTCSSISVPGAQPKEEKYWSQEEQKGIETAQNREDGRENAERHGDEVGFSLPSPDLPLRNRRTLDPEKSRFPREDRGKEGDVPQTSLPYASHTDLVRSGSRIFYVQQDQEEKPKEGEKQLGAGASSSSSFSPHFEVPVETRIHDFFQHDAVTPYTYRSKIMEHQNIGWSPPGETTWLKSNQAGKDGAREERGSSSRSSLSRTPRRLLLQRPKKGMEGLGRMMDGGRGGRRACCHGKVASTSLYVSPNSSYRYRKIEDLTTFIRSGGEAVTPETRYFLDAMARREPEETTFVPIQQKVISGCDDPRDERVWGDDAEGKKNRLQARLRSAIPRRAQLSKLKYDHTTGMVKPYALGKTATVSSSTFFSEFSLESTLERFVATMQCQRPSKGLRGPLTD